MTRPAHATVTTATASATAQESRVSPVTRLSTSPVSTTTARARPTAHIIRSGRIRGLREGVDNDVPAVVDAGHAGDRVELAEVGPRQGGRAAGDVREDAAGRRLVPAGAQVYH